MGDTTIRIASESAIDEWGCHLFEGNAAAPKPIGTWIFDRRFPAHTVREDAHDDLAYDGPSRDGLANTFWFHGALGRKAVGTGGRKAAFAPS